MLTTVSCLLFWLIITEVYVDYRARMYTLEVLDGQKHETSLVAVIYFGLTLLIFLFWRQGTT